MKKKKKVSILLGILIIFIAGIFIFKSCSKSTKQGKFKFGKITRGNLENIVSSTGTISAVETVEVGSQVSGIIEKLYVDFNDEVVKGQVLAVLDKTLFQASLNDAEAGVIRAKAQLVQAEAELKRDQPLFEKDHLSEMEFLATKTAAETARADYSIAEAALKRAETNLEYTVIRSPISGTVIERTVDEGQTIAASFQAPQLFIIAEDLTRMQIEASVDESDIGQIKKNQTVRFEVQAYPDEIFNGKVRQIRLQPTTVQNVVNYTVVVDATNEMGKLLPGMTATVDFMIDVRHDVLLVPNTALNYKPTIEVMKKYGPKMRPDMGRKPNANSLPPVPMGAGNENMKDKKGEMPEGMGIVFYLDEEGILRFANLEIGVTDGIITEIVKSPLLKEGMGIITGFNSTGSESTESNNRKATFFPPPPGGRHGGGPR